MFLKEKYFRNDISELYSEESGLRWYSPCDLGGADFYEALASQYKWYYQVDSWDKQTAMGLLSKLQIKSMFEIGCGNGLFLKKMKEMGIDAKGTDFNVSAIDSARLEDLDVHVPDSLPSRIADVDCMCAFQTIEHIHDPVAFLRHYIDICSPRYILMSAPTHESLLGKSSDPLAWPPHHATQWSQRAFACLAGKVGYKVSAVYRDRLSYKSFVKTAARETNGPKTISPVWPGERLGRLAFQVYKTVGFSWARHHHSILVLLEQDT